MAQQSVISSLLGSVAASGNPSLGLGDLLIAMTFGPVRSSDLSNRVLNPAGIPLVARKHGPFGGACVFFPFGVDSGVLDPSMGSGLDFGAQDFTVEFWVKSSVVGALSATRTFIGIFSGNAAYNAWRVYYDSGRIYGQFRTTSASTLRTVYFTMPAGVAAFEAEGWHHVAFQRRGTECEIYVDGVRGEATYAIGSDAINGPNSYYPPYYGAHCGVAGGEKPAQSAQGCFMDLVRITKGVARYVGDFLRPNTVYPVGAEDPYWDNVVWHITHGGNWGYDSSPAAKNQLPLTFNAAAADYSVGYSLNAAYVGHLGADGMVGRASTSEDSARLKIQDTSYDLGSSDFTFDIICRRRTTDVIADSAGFGIPGVFSFANRSPTSTFGFTFAFASSDGESTLEYNFTAVSTTADTAFCAVRTGGTLNFWRDGVRVGAVAFPYTMKSLFRSSSNYSFYLVSPRSGIVIKAVRLIRGHAKYTGETRTIPTIEDLRSL